MSSSAIISVSELKSKKNSVIITKLKYNKDTKKYSAAFLYIVDKSANLFGFETSSLRVDFGASYFGSQNKDTITPEEQRNYSIMFRPDMSSPEFIEQSEAFMEFLDTLKEMAISFGIENSQLILKRKFDMSQKEMMVETSFTYPVKQKAKPDGTFYSPNIQVKIPKNKESGLPDISLFRDHAGNIEQINLVSWEQLQEIAPRGVRCKAIFRPMLSFVNKCMNFTLRLVQLKVFTVDKLTIPKSYAFSDTPMEVKKTTEHATENPSDDNFGTEPMIVESDEDQDAEEVDVTDA